MPSDKELIREIQTHATTLSQAVAAAKEWHKRYTAEIEHTLQERLAANQTEYDQAMERIQREHQQAMDAVHQELQEVEQACGLWAVPWDDPAWETFKPDSGAPVPYLTRLGTMRVPGISESRSKMSSSTDGKDSKRSRILAAPSPVRADGAPFGAATDSKRGRILAAPPAVTTRSGG